MKYWALGLLLLVSCGSGGHASPPTITRPDNVVDERASAFRSITVAGNGRTATLSLSQVTDVAPLLTGRVFDQPDALSTYGLDHPPARLTYTRADGRAQVILVGNPNFDRHGFYVQRAGERAVYLTPADQLRPVLALVGIDVAPPSD